jgi:hypothetical protein
MIGIAHRIQEGQVRGRVHVAGGRGGARRWQCNGRTKLRGRESRVGAVHKCAAHKGVEVRQEIDWVLGEVGVAVVFERENLGGEGIAWGRAVEVQTATGDGQPGEALESPPLDSSDHRGA